MFRKILHTSISKNYTLGRNNFCIPSSVTLRHFSVERDLDLNSDRNILSADTKNSAKSTTLFNRSTLQKPTSVLDESLSKIENEVKSLKYINEVLDFLRNNPKLDLQLCDSLVNVIFSLQKSGRTNLSNKELIQTREIENFCKYLTKNARFLTLNQILNVLKLLNYLHVSTNSVLNQHLLQMLTKCVNQMSLRQIAFAFMLLKNAAPSALIDALKIALPVVFDANVRIKLDYENPSAVVEALNFASRNKISPESTRILTKAALKISHRFNLKFSYQTLMALCHTRRRLFSDEKLLFEQCMEIIHGKLGDFSFEDIALLVSLVLDKYVFDNVCFYDQKLISESCEYVIDKKLNVLQAGKLLRILNKVSYSNVKLLKYIDECLNSVSNFNSLSAECITSFIISCSNCKFIPENWENYKSELVSFIEDQKDKSVSLHRILLDLIVLDCWVPSLIEYGFSEKYIKDKFFSENVNVLDYIVFLNIYQVAQTLGSNKILNQPSPPSDIIEKAIDLSCNREVDSSVTRSLANGCGGKEYVLNGVRTALGFYIDHLLIKCKDGSMFPINKSGTEEKSDVIWETLDFPKDGYSIGVILLSPASYCVNGIEIRGRIKILLDAIETLGINIIPISMAVWNNLPSNERIPYLMDNIESKIPQRWNRLNSCEVVNYPI